MSLGIQNIVQKSVLGSYKIAKQNSVSERPHLRTVRRRMAWQLLISVLGWRKAVN